MTAVAVRPETVEADEARQVLAAAVTKLTAVAGAAPNRMLANPAIACDVRLVAELADSLDLQLRCDTRRNARPYERETV